MSLAALSVMSFISVCDIEFILCGTTLRGKVQSPLLLANIPAISVKSSLINTTVGMPLSMSSIAAWTLHVVHAPQLARATIAASQLLATSSRVCGGA